MLGLTHSDNAVVSSSVRTLRIIYESGLAPSNPIFEDPSIARLLVHMISGPPLVAQSAATILTKACQVSPYIHTYMYGVETVQKLCYIYRVIYMAAYIYINVICYLVEEQLQYIHNHIMSIYIIIHSTM